MSKNIKKPANNEEKNKNGNSNNNNPKDKKIENNKLDEEKIENSKLDEEKTEDNNLVEEDPKRVEKIKSFKLEIDEDAPLKEGAQETVKVSETVSALVEEKNEEDFALYINNIQQNKRKSVDEKRSVGAYKAPSGKKRKNKKSVFLGCTLNFIYIIIVAGISLALGAYILICANDAFALIKDENTATIEVTKDDDIETISEKLKEEGIIDQPFAFRLFAKVTKKEENFKPGKYMVRSTVGYDQIIKALNTDLTNMETVEVVFPEGWTLEEMVDELADKGVCPKDRLMGAIDNAKLDYPLINEMEDNPDRYYRLEGYMFPDTYEFYVGSNEEDVLSKFLDNTEVRITEEMRKKANEMDMTIDEILTLASIIQKEANSAKVMYEISGLFHNRLEPDSEIPWIQSDPTMNYYTEKYNTYLFEGLPPGPICNPGLDAINAALNPNDTDYMFFLTDKDGNYYWAETYEEHLINIDKAGLIGVTGGTGTASTPAE